MLEKLGSPQVCSHLSWLPHTPLVLPIPIRVFSQNMSGSIIRVYVSLGPYHCHTSNPIDQTRHNNSSSHTPYTPTPHGIPIHTNFTHHSIHRRFFFLKRIYARIHNYFQHHKYHKTHHEPETGQNRKRRLAAHELPLGDFWKNPETRRKRE